MNVYVLHRNNVLDHKKEEQQFYENIKVLIALYELALVK